MSDQFPEHYTSEIGLPYWQRYRHEDRTCKDGPRGVIAYIRKMISKKLTAPHEELNHFDQHRSVLRGLQGPPAPESLRLALVGDLMWLRDGWGSFLDPGARDYLNAHDAVVGNLESVVSPRFKVKSFWPDYATFNSHPDLVRSFRRPDGRNTFSALSVANNHSLDYGDTGARDTHAFLKGESIPQSGLKLAPNDRPYTTFRVGDFTFGFYAATYGLNSGSKSQSQAVQVNEVYGADDSGAPFALDELRQALSDMDADGVDFRIVSLHWGYEFEYYPAPRHVRLAREVIRAGADLIIGSHPHVQQPCETLFVNGYERRYPESIQGRADTRAVVIQADGAPRKALVAYSMGNMATTQWTLACRVGWILSLRLSRGAETGRLDWELDGSAFVVNVPRMPRTRERKLFLWEDYVRVMCERGCNVPRRESAYINFLDRHLWGSATETNSRGVSRLF